MRLRFSLSNILLLTVICALGIMNYRQAVQLKSLTRQFESHQAIYAQTHDVLEREATLRMAIEETLAARQDKSTFSIPSWRGIPITRTSNRAPSTEAEISIRGAKLRLKRARALLGEMESLAKQQLSSNQ